MLVRFFVFAYVIAWALWIPLVLSKRGLGLIPVDLPLQSLLPGTFAPTVSAFFAHRWSQGNWRAIDFFSGWRRAWLGIVIGPILILVGEVIIPVLFISSSPATRLHWNFLFDYPRWVFYWGVLLASPLGEEPGWRGYALPRLQTMFGPFRATLLLGLLWAFWHTPLFFVKGWTDFPFGVFVMAVVGWSLIITFVFNLSGGNVVVAVVAHSAANACPHFLENLLKGVPERTEMTTIVIAISLLLQGGILVALTRARLGIQRPTNLSNP